jgi:lipopolysaccharide export system ATP-binding protein
LGHLATESLDLAVGRHQILSNISVQVRTNEIVGLLGRDGSGKTCLFELLAGLVSPSSGTILFDGADITGWNEDERARHGLAYLPEEPSIFRNLTVAENIQLALDIVEPVVEARSIRLERLLEAFQLLDVRDQLATSLSGGERRRCEVARALAAQPTILMLDEPFRGLDPMSVVEVAKAINGLKDEGVGLLVSDYDLHDLIDLIDRAYVLHEGQVIFSGTSSELLADCGVRHSYLGESFAL